jgi:hypothetical protein
LLSISSRSPSPRFCEGRVCDFIFWLGTRYGCQTEVCHPPTAFLKEDYGCNRLESCRWPIAEEQTMPGARDWNVSISHHLVRTYYGVSHFWNVDHRKRHNQNTSSSTEPVKTSYFLQCIQTVLRAYNALTKKMMRLPTGFVFVSWPPTHPASALSLPILRYCRSESSRQNVLYCRFHHDGCQ